MPDARRVVEHIWYDDAIVARLARVVLLPVSFLFRAAVGARALAYRTGLARPTAAPLPAVSIGNLTVGGTGKTPIAAWIAGELGRRGASPAVVLRGVGDDETAVHALLNPGVPIIADADRIAGMREAKERGADVVVLDDAFQHRRAERVADIVLIGADGWSRPRHLLPAGGWREPLGALARASLALITRKAATDDAVQRVQRAVERTARGLPIAIVRLESAELRRLDRDDDVAAMSALERRHVLAIAGIADPHAFFAQVASAGPESVDGATFADHHAFTAADVSALSRRARGVQYVVCTLKDAVKLAPLWPRAGAPLWYVSQRVVVESGGERIDALLAELLRRRHRDPRGPSPDAASYPR
jgi:tetraacyldisaccharide 4'-kinase